MTKTDGLYSIHFEPLDGVIEVVATGFWKAADVARYMADLAWHVSDVRRAGRPVRVLGDLRECQPREDEAAQLVGARNVAIYQPEDRCAIVTSSTILKMQMRRYALPDRQLFFSDLEGARAWLLDGAT